ncbi:MAG TPA: 1-acyl-sn-glycerol-3-phosphate acyltransferase [Candidatus Enterousia intestinigallinarum]|uniref:1-acyl-sn-glycerol-3-phosphate acyltransferase n=1 Tax=Candidatus Enterousia intestinigallinarum TaxID=2840790 RepID=A0A9D1JX47_9PROT|nr:1-acyl-sn-glycerol-3-phosphate acyltransferase [Candidatus Enterousia intestinigallinarum]
MGRVRRQNFFNTFGAVLKFALFWILVAIQLPIILFLPRGRASVRYMRFFMRILLYVVGVRVRVHGKLVAHRPLLVISNHISIFEIATFPVAFGGSFIAKKEMESWPLVGWVARKFGVVFIDRRPSHAMDALTQVQQTLRDVSYPIFLFPEGTTTNGAYVKPFKSTLFNFVENSDVLVQPMVMNYRFHDGGVISDADLAEHFAYFNNSNQDTGPRCSRERSAFGQVFHIMVLGGFLVELTVLPPPPLAGMDRKQIAETLQKIVSEKYMELKNKTAK